MSNNHRNLHIYIETAPISYPIYIGNGVIGGLTRFISGDFPESEGHTISSKFSPSSIFVISNKTVIELHGEKILAPLQEADLLVETILMGDGEQYKNPEEFLRVCGELIERGVKRSSVAIALGGGVTGDLAGFVSATVMRGIPLIHIPTTLVAQVDSSIGGKVGIDLPMGKNLLGTFYSPRMVITDPRLLYTLPYREFACGMAEVIKSALIADSELFKILENCPEKLENIPVEIMEEIVFRAAKVKAEIVTQDPFETGERMKLNLGHTIGHALESASGYSRYSHGEAVAIGLRASLEISKRLGILEDMSLPNRAEELLRKFNLPVKFEGIDINKIMESLKFDKKRVDEGIRFVLVRAMGNLQIVNIVDRGVLIEALKQIEGSPKNFFGAGKIAPRTEP